jgi:cysteine desulfurase
MIYLDNAATTPVNPKALQAAWPWLTEEFGNPSSSHELGQRAAVALETARESVAKFLGARASDITFTSGGTESDNLAIIGIALANPRGRHIVSAKTEHQAVLESLEFLERNHGFDITWLKLDEFGNILNFAQALRPDTTLVSLMLSNNEIGTIHPIAELAKQAHDVGAFFHTDAVQAVGWVNLNVKELGIDALSISGHKFGAPKGSGVLFLKSGVSISPLIHGGGQEKGVRSGTENLAWAVALQTALEQLGDQSQESARVAKLRDGFIEKVLTGCLFARLTGDPKNRAANLASFTFSKVSGEALLLELERRGVIVSSGSACAAGRNDPSHVLLAIGIEPEVAQTAVRFSFSHQITEAELDTAAKALLDSISVFI